MTGYHMGINLGHDRSVAVVRGGEILVAIEQERLDRIKHSVGFMVQSPHLMQHIQVPGECIRYCLDALDLPLSKMATITANMPGRDFAPDILRGKFSRDISGRVHAIPSHHLAHAYSAWWPSGMDDALVLVADGSGSTECAPSGHWRTESYTLYTARDGHLKPLHHVRVQAHLASLSTLGFIYEYISRKAGFETRIGTHIRFAEAGKLMGLAAFGGRQSSWERWLSPVAGEPRVSMSAYDIFLEVAALERVYDTPEGRPYMRPWLVDLSHKVQHELEEALCHIVAEACAQTGLNQLCMAGGVALNSVANYKILQRCGLDDIFIFPAAADNGIAAGCALWAYAELEEGVHRPPLQAATLGQAAPRSQVDAALAAHADLLVVEEKQPDDMVAAVAEALSSGSIVARYEGGCEYGPRALGHRSILADPTFARMKDVINARVKFREAFRPFAPVIPLDRAAEVFALGTKSPFMLLVADIRPEFQAALPAITHADGTGRVQTCTADHNPFFHSLCNALAERRPGPPVLLNTSFNVAGQPIVETPTEAISTFLRTDIDYLALEDRWICKRHTPVKAYADHEATLVDGELPVGLPPGAPSVRPLMAELDRALFHGGATRRWSLDALADLSRQGARFKETSRLYPEHGYLGRLQTELGANAVVLLDPLGTSTLADPTERQPPLTLTSARLEMLLATRQAPSDGIADALRCRLGLGHRELTQQLTQLRQDIARFGLDLPEPWLIERPPQNSLLPDAAGPTLAPFADPHFRLETSLAHFRAALATHGYTESAIVAALGVDSLQPVESLQQIEPTHLHWHATFQLTDTPLADLIRLFQLRASRPRARVDALFGTEVVADLVTLGIFIPDGDQLRAGVDLFCSGGMIFATDHRYMLLEGDRLDEEPVMYIGMDSHGLVQTAPRAACATVLDLCCGSGIQGLVATRYGRKVVAVDLNPRAVRFARFNAQLNEASDYEVRLGSLYEPVAGEQFDVILANPPFVPSPEMGLAFRDGGVRGESILRQIVAGAPTHLTKTGRLCIVTDLVDISGYGPKLQGWWGPSGMDALIASTADRDEMLFSVPHCHAPFGQSIEGYEQELGRWVQNFRTAKLDAVNFGYLLVWRSSDDHRTVTTRVIHNPATPMHREVSDWRVQQAIRTQADARGHHLCLHPKARLHHAHAPDGSASSYELSVPGSDFFTTYALSERVYTDLCHIAKVGPTLDDVVCEANGWIDRLLSLGVLRLEATRPVRAAAQSVDAPDVIEQATKTTPTCLSSYLG